MQQNYYLCECVFTKSIFNLHNFSRQQKKTKKLNNAYIIYSSIQLKVTSLFVVLRHFLIVLSKKIFDAF